MPQLRDAHTSELIAEGTPLELVHLADELGLKAGVVPAGAKDAGDLDLIYDDVGEAFDADAVRQAHDADREGLRAVSKDRDVHDELRKSAKARAEHIDATIAGARAVAAATAERIDAAQDADRPTLDPVTLTVPE